MRKNWRAIGRERESEWTKRGNAILIYFRLCSRSLNLLRYFTERVRRTVAVLRQHFLIPTDTYIVRMIQIKRLKDMRERESEISKTIITIRLRHRFKEKHSRARNRSWLGASQGFLYLLSVLFSFLNNLLYYFRELLYYFRILFTRSCESIL